MEKSGNSLTGLLIIVLLSACQSTHTLKGTEKKINGELAKQQGTFALAYKDLSTGEKLLIREHEVFHAASTMKTPVMIEVFKQASQGKFSLKDSLLVRNEFRSIVDGSPFTLNPNGDSDRELYGAVGTNRTVLELVNRMITRSSNLATNLVIEKVGAKNVTQSMRELGAADIEVLRGVEDSLAFERQLNNQTTAFDLMTIFEKMAEGQTVSPEASRSMIDILLDQHFTEIIPARLPRGVKVAHKGGNITGVRHDSGIVFVPGGTKYVLVLLSRGLTDEKAATKAMAKVSLLIYKHVRLSK